MSKVIVCCIAAVVCTFLHEQTTLTCEAGRTAIEIARLQMQRDAQAFPGLPIPSRPNSPSRGYGGAGKPSIEVVPDAKGLRL